MSDQTRTGEQVERGAAEEAAGAPLTQTEIDADRRAPSAPGTGSDAVTEDDGSGMAGGSSGGSGGGSGMPGHPDAAGS